MKRKSPHTSYIIGAVLVLALLLTGFIVVRTITGSGAKAPTNVAPTPQENVPENTSVEVNVTKSASKDNTVVLSISKLEGSYAGIEYEVTYESQGVLKGVNSGSKPIDVTGQNEFTRDVYMGTCSRNVCKPDPGVTQVSVALSFTDGDGAKSQFSKDFPL